MYDRILIKAAAREQMRAHQGTCVLVYVVYLAAVGLIGRATWGIVNLLLMPPLVVGLSAFFLGVFRGQRPPFESLLQGFYRYTQSLIAILWTYLWTFLWSLLFVIPGIIKYLSYSMTQYLIVDFPDLDPRRAMRISIAITDGYKAEIFIMYLSFLGWALLSALTFGILQVLFVGPYVEASMAGQYEALLATALERGTITEADLHNRAC